MPHLHFFAQVVKAHGVKAVCEVRAVKVEFVSIAVNDVSEDMPRYLIAQMFADEMQVDFVQQRRRWLGHSEVGIARSTRDETFGATVAASSALGDETEDTEPVPLNAILPQGEEGKRGRQNRLGI